MRIRLESDLEDIKEDDIILSPDHLSVWIPLSLVQDNGRDYLKFRVKDLDGITFLVDTLCVNNLARKECKSSK